MVSDAQQRHPDARPQRRRMESGNPLQQLLLRGLGTTSLVADRLRGVTQEWVSRGRLDPNQASALVDDVMKALPVSYTHLTLPTNA